MISSRALVAAAALLLSTSAIACSSADANDAEQGEQAVSKAAAVTDAALQAELTKLSAGLTFQSEADFPYEVVTSSAPLAAGQRVGGKVVREAFQKLPSQEAGGKTLADMPDWEYRPIASFEADDPEDPEIDPELAKAFAAFDKVRASLLKNLTNVKVIRFGKKELVTSGAQKGKPSRFVSGVQGQVQIFIVGRSKSSGKIIGIRTLAIET